MKVVLAGATGLIGRALVPALLADKHDATVLTRASTVDVAGAPAVRWDGRHIDEAYVQGTDAIVNLSGATIGGRRAAVVVDLVASLGTEAFIISALLAVAFRSLSLGLIAMVPNLFPLAITGTFMYFLGSSAIHLVVPSRCTSLSRTFAAFQ